jgi:hypothetical protein
MHTVFVKTLRFELAATPASCRTVAIVYLFEDLFPKYLPLMIEQDYPEMHQRAQAEDAEIPEVAETAVRQDTAWLRAYAAAGSSFTGDWLHICNLFQNSWFSTRYQTLNQSETMCEHELYRCDGPFSAAAAACDGLGHWPVASDGHCAQRQRESPACGFARPGIA